MKQEIDLKHLAELPYGAAALELKKLGLWKEEAAAETGKQMLYKVEVSGTHLPEIKTETVEVMASSPDEARLKAEDMTDFDEFEGTEIVHVRNADA